MITFCRHLASLKIGISKVQDFDNFKLSLMPIDTDWRGGDILYLVWILSVLAQHFLVCKTSHELMGESSNFQNPELSKFKS